MTFVSRSTIFNWFSDNSICLSSIEEIGKGDKLIMLINKIMNSNIINYKEHPQVEGDYIYNLNKVKAYSTMNKIKICFPVERMVKLRMQDNLEFIQLLYRYVHKDRRQSIIMSNFRNKEIINNTNMKVEHNVDHNTNDNVDHNTNDIVDAAEINEVKVEFYNGECKNKECIEIQKELNMLRYKNSNVDLQKELDEMQHKLNKYKDKIKGVIGEMNYYYNKVVSVEKIVNEKMDDTEVKQEILKILYED